MPTLAYSNFQSITNGGVSTTLTSTSFTPQTNDIIVAKVVTADAAEVIGTPSGGGWTYTKRIGDTTSSHVGAGLWTAPVTTGGTAQTVAVGVTQSGGNVYCSMTVELWRSAQLAASPATCDARGSGAPSTSLTTVAANSYVSWCNGDWAAVSGSATYLSGATQEGTYPGDGSQYGSYFAYQSAASTGAQTLGMSAPTGQTWTLIGIEIQDSGGGGGTVTGGKSLVIPQAVKRASLW